MTIKYMLTTKDTKYNICTNAVATITQRIKPAEAGKEKIYRSNRGDSKIRLENIHTKIWDENVSGKLLPKAINNMHG